MNYKGIIQFFWQHIKPYKWWYLVMLMAPIITSFYPFAYNYAIKLFLDTMDVTSNLKYQDILFPIILFIVTQLLLDIVWRFSNYAEWKSEPYVRQSIISYSYGYTQNHSYKFFQDNFAGAITSKIKGILDGYDKFWAEVHHGLGLKIFKVIVNLGALSWINHYLGLFVLCWIAVYMPVMYFLSKRLNYLSFEESESRHSLIGQVSDKINNIISIKAFAASVREHKNLNKQIANDFVPKQIKVYKYDFFTQIVGGLIYLVMFTFILFYVLHLKMHGLISIGDFAFVFGISIIVAEDIWQATISLQDFARAMGDLKSSLSIITIPQDNLDIEDAKQLEISDGKIEFKNVNFNYGGEQTLFNDFNLIINPGEKIGLVGHSGSGKSTLANLLLRYFKIDNGSILVDEQNINKITKSSLREGIAIIPQDTMLFHRNLMENIRFGKPTATDEEVIQAAEKAHIHDYIMTLPEQYDSMVGERGLKLSGGQRQRIAIARAVLKNAPVLILDEATSALDSNTERLIQNSLNFFIEDKSKTVIAIAHRLSTLKNMDRIIVIDKGEIIEVGTHEELISHEQSTYKMLWGLQEI